MDFLPIVITSIVSILASSGFWAFVQNRSDKNNAQTKLLVGIAHDRIIWLGKSYIDRNYVTNDELENLHDYLYLPYKALKGNGTCDVIMERVKKLEIR